MRISDWTPSILPRGDHQDVYLVVDDLGRFGRAWRETVVGATDFETVVAQLLEGQYSNPVRVVCFNTAERWSRDVSDDIARALRRRCDSEGRGLPASIAGFVE
jgi:hypothetical protein